MRIEGPIEQRSLAEAGEHMAWRRHSSALEETVGERRLQHWIHSCAFSLGVAKGLYEAVSLALAAPARLPHVSMSL